MAQAIGSFIDRIQLGDDETHQIAIGSSAYGVCDTAAGTAAKTVDIPGFTLNIGTTIHVKFTNTNTASNLTLNVSSTGAVSIILYDNIVADTVLTLTYDGTNWIQDYNSDQKVNVTLKNTTTSNEYIHLLGTTIVPTSTASAQEVYGSTSLYVNGVNQGKLELVLGNAIKTTSTGGQFGQLALYSTGTNGTYLKSEANDTDWYTAILPAKTGTLVMLKENNGPISTTATAIAIYSDTTGTLDNSLATIDSSGNITATSFIGNLTGNVTGNITGTASNVTGTIAVANGGTGNTSFTDSCVIVPSTTNGTQIFASTGLKVLGITTDDITLSPYTAGQAMTISSTTGTMTISTSTAAMTLSTTSGNMSLSSGGTILITSASTKSTTITSGHTLSLSSGNLQDISLTSAKDIVLTNDTTTIKLISTSLQPNANQGAGLGSATNRWSNLYIGSTDSYGDAYTPIYWNSGVPAAITPIQYVSFSITDGNEGVELAHTAFTANSYVLQIVVDTGEQYLSSPIEWTSATGTITLSCATVTGTVSGYIVVSRGDTLSSVTTTQQAASI